MTLLQVRSLHAGYGTAEALRGVSFSLPPNSIFAVLGSNGAGKTTLLRCISGLTKPCSGSVIFSGIDVADYSTSDRKRLGIAHVPEGRQLFPQHSVLENLELGAYQLLLGGERRKFQDLVDMVTDLFPVVGERLQQPAGLLSGGEQQMVAIARALVGQPRLLMLDEPSLGLAPVLVRALMTKLSQLRSSGMTILLVEQLARIAVPVSDKILILKEGQVEYTGSPNKEDLDYRLLRAYLGS